MPQVSFSADIKPLFRAIDISHMKPIRRRTRQLQLHVESGQRKQSARDSSPHDGEPPTMPPGGPYWTADQLALFAQWQSGGYQP